MVSEKYSDGWLVEIVMETIEQNASRIFAERPGLKGEMEVGEWINDTSHVKEANFRARALYDATPESERDKILSELGEVFRLTYSILDKYNKRNKYKSRMETER